MSAKNIASFFVDAMPGIWDSTGETYDTWANAIETAKSLGAEIADIDNNSVIATFPDKSTCIIDRDGNGVREDVFNGVA